MTADNIFGRDPVHNNAFSFIKVYIFTRFGLAFTLKRSNGGLGSKKKSSRKQRLIVLMRAAKNRILKSADVRACDAFTGEIDERFVCRLARKQALPGVRGWGREKGKI